MKTDIRLARRIQLGAVFLVGLFAFGLFVLLDRHQHQALLAHVGADLSERAELSASRVSQVTQKLSQDVLFLSRTPPISGIRRAISHGGIDPRDGNSREVWLQRLREIFQAFIEAHPDYTQVRYIGVANQGRELVRVDRAHGRIVVVPEAELQAKGDRPYFRDAMRLPERSVYLSDIDLNEEHDRVQWPLVRTLRAVTPVYGPDGMVFGLVVINMDVGAWFDAMLGQAPYQALT